MERAHSLVFALIVYLSVFGIASGDLSKRSQAQQKVKGAKQFVEDPVNAARRDKVREAMLHAWTSYEKYSWGSDQLQPRTKDGDNSYGGLGVTIVDSLDTLYIMGLKDQFRKAKEWVARSLDFNRNREVGVFETTIRIVGGLLSAYDLSGEKVFLHKAKDMADRLLPAWNTKTGIPISVINLATGKARSWPDTHGNSVLAEIGSTQLEFIALSQRTKDLKYQEKVEKVIEVLNLHYPADGLLPTLINPETGRPSESTISFGGMGDSFYEYLLKAWIQGNKTHAVKLYRDMWETSMKGLHSLVRISTPSNYAYICEKNGGMLVDEMPELACFTPGMLALGSRGYAPAEAKGSLSLAKKLMRTCYDFYRMTRTKLAGESYTFRPAEDMIVSLPQNLLRPETVESLFYLWRLTGNKRYRDWGWDIFQAFEKHSHIPTGYVGLEDVNTGAKDNTMQSFFLGETLKYLYLLFSPPSLIPLDQWVLNTEAHPLKIITRPNHSKISGRSKG